MTATARSRERRPTRCARCRPARTRRATPAGRPPGVPTSAAESARTRCPTSSRNAARHRSASRRPDAVGTSRTSRWSSGPRTLRTSPSRTSSATSERDLALRDRRAVRPSSFIVMPGSRVTRTRTTTVRVTTGSSRTRSARSLSSAFIIPFTSRRRSTTSSSGSSGRSENERSSSNEYTPAMDTITWSYGAPRRDRRRGPSASATATSRPCAASRSTVAAGETFGFLGPNGAGKSTTISMLCTLLTPDCRAQPRVAGFDVVAAAARRCAGGSASSSRSQTLDEYLTAAGEPRFHAELYGVPRPTIDAPRRSRCMRDGRAVGRGGRSIVAHLLGRHEAPARDRARAPALAPRAVPRRADRRARPADARPHLGLHRRAARRARRSRSSSRPTTWTRPSTATGSRSSTTARSSPSTRRTTLKAHGRQGPRSSSAPTTTTRRSRAAARTASASKRSIASNGAVRVYVAAGDGVRPDALRRARRPDPCRCNVARADARRRVHDLHRPHDPRRGGVVDGAAAASSPFMRRRRADDARRRSRSTPVRLAGGGWRDDLTPSASSGTAS